MKDTDEGIIVAGGQGKGKYLAQLSNPNGIFVDEFETIYIADTGNNRVVRWFTGSKQGEVVLGGNDQNQLSSPVDLLFDEENNLFLTNQNYHRVQKFSVIKA